MFCEFDCVPSRCLTVAVIRVARGGQVITIAVRGMKVGTLIPTLSCRVQPESIVYIDSYRTCGTLNVIELHLMRINHTYPVAAEQNPINGVESF